MDTILKELDILNVMRGATLFASGGGGAYQDGVDLLNAFKKNHPEMAQDLFVSLCPPGEMNQGSSAAAVAVMGAPTGALEQMDLSDCVKNAFDEITKLATRYSRKIDYMLPVEMGGFNTFVPMLISLLTGRAIIDADACGRAVPGLETVLASINGCATAPAAMADIHNNRVNLIPANLKDTSLIEKMALPVVDLFEQNAGIAGWMMTKDEVNTLIPNNTITKAKQIGELISTLKTRKPAGQKYVDEIFGALNKAQIVTAQQLHGSPQKITGYTSNPIEGWDVGEFYVGGTSGFDPKMHVRFSNENLVVEKQRFGGDTWTTIMTAPDIISIYDAKTGDPLTNEDLEIANRNGTIGNFDVMLGAIKVDEKWHRDAYTVSRVWAKYFKLVGYSGGIVPYRSV